MNHYGGKELAESFRTVRRNTLTIARDIPEDQYSFRAAPGTRSVAELLAHIAVAHTVQHQIHVDGGLKTLVGLNFPKLMQEMAAEEKMPRSKDQIVEMLVSSGEKWATFLNGLENDFLAGRVDMPAGATPTSRSRFDMVLSVKEHEMHHRGQLMLIERIIGIVPHLTRDMQARHAAATAKN